MGYTVSIVRPVFVNSSRLPPKLQLTRSRSAAGVISKLAAARSVLCARSSCCACLRCTPRDRPAEQPALALYGERGKTVTVRARLHRLRAHLGAQVVETQPYRLPRALDADWVKVLPLVTAGGPGAALSAYRGRLVPASDAPEIRETRGLLEESLQRSILTSGDPQLLARWLTHPSGGQDLAAARWPVAVLTISNAHRAAATATAALIAPPDVAGSRLTAIQ